MKHIRMLFIIALSLFTLMAATRLTLAQQPDPTKQDALSPDIGTTIYVPIVYSSYTYGKNSYELIDADVAAGIITAEQGLVYKAFSLFSDAQLPAKYIGNDTLPEDADSVMKEIINEYGSLSNETKQTLAPFYIPPDDPNSWYYHPHLGESGEALAQQPQQVEWKWASAVGGTVRILYRSDNILDAAKAATIASEFDTRIWPELTTLMNIGPVLNPEGTLDVYLWNSYKKFDGAVVPFDGRGGGMTVPSSCDASNVNIYVNDNYNLGSWTSPGMIQITTHEFMHALQFALPMDKCDVSYAWLMEATAVWSEDYVYPLADEEHRFVQSYLNKTSVRLDNTENLHQYGAYLLFYYLTHAIDQSAQVVADTWWNCTTTTNIYQAIDAAVNKDAPDLHDYYWTGFITSLWNKGPFNTFYATNDQIYDSARPVEGNSTTQITANSGQNIIKLPADIPTGGVVYRHLSFPDNSVHSLAVLNGIGYKLRVGPASEDGSISEWVKDGDETYLFDELSAADLTGAHLILLMKEGNYSATPLPMTMPNLNIQNDGFCIDVQGKIQDMVVILSNWDYAHPNRIMSPAGQPTTIFASNLPCNRLSGTSSHTYYEAYDPSYGVTQATQATVSYQNQNIFSQAGNLIPTQVFPYVELSQVSAQASWNISGNDDPESWYIGDGSYSAGGGSGCVIDILTGVLKGGPSYRGYIGCGDGDPDTEITYVHHWIDDQGEHSEDITDYAWTFLDIDEAVGYNGNYYPVLDNGIFGATGSYTDEYGNKTSWDWLLTIP